MSRFIIYTYCRNKILNAFSSSNVKCTITVTILWLISRIIHPINHNFSLNWVEIHLSPLRFLFHVTQMQLWNCLYINRVLQSSETSTYYTMHTYHTILWKGTCCCHRHTWRNVNSIVHVTFNERASEWMNGFDLWQHRQWMTMSFRFRCCCYCGISRTEPTTSVMEVVLFISENFYSPNPSCMLILPIPLLWFSPHTDLFGVALIITLV